MTAAKDLGRKVLAWRKSRALTQEAAAKAAGISQSVWSELELGELQRIGLDVAMRVVEVSEGEIALAAFPRPRGKKVRPVPAPDSTISVTGNSPEADDVQSRAG